MANTNIETIKRRINKGGVVILNLKEFRKMEKRIEEFTRKQAVLKNLESFEGLATWGRKFAKAKGITEKQVLEDD